MFISNSRINSKSMLCNIWFAYVYLYEFQVSNQPDSFHIEFCSRHHCVQAWNLESIPRRIVVSNSGGSCVEYSFSSFWKNDDNVDDSLLRIVGLKLVISFQTNNISSVEFPIYVIINMSHDTMTFE